MREQRSGYSPPVSLPLLFPLRMPPRTAIQPRPFVVRSAFICLAVSFREATSLAAAPRPVWKAAPDVVLRPSLPRAIRRTTLGGRDFLCPPAPALPSSPSSPLFCALFLVTAPFLFFAVLLVLFLWLSFVTCVIVALPTTTST